MKITLDQLLSEEHRMVRENARRFADRELGPIAREIDEEERFPTEVYKKAGEYGLIGSTSPVEYGGGGADVLTNALIKEEFCRVASGFGMSVNMCTTNFCFLISKYGTESQKTRYIPPVIRGDDLACLLSDGTGRRIRCPFPEDLLPARRGRLYSQRKQNLYHQRPDCPVFYDGSQGAGNDGREGGNPLYPRTRHGGARHGKTVCKDGDALFPHG